VPTKCGTIIIYVTIYSLLKLWLVEESQADLKYWPRPRLTFFEHSAPNSDSSPGRRRLDQSQNLNMTVAAVVVAALAAWWPSDERHMRNPSWMHDSRRTRELRAATACVPHSTLVSSSIAPAWRRGRCSIHLAMILGQHFRQC